MIVPFHEIDVHHIYHKYHLPEIHWQRRAPGKEALGWKKDRITNKSSGVKYLVKQALIK